jgi:chaperone BCS1
MIVPQTMAEVWATTGSTIASFMFIWAPYEGRLYFGKYTQRIMSFFYPYIKISIHEYTGDRLERSEAYYAAVVAYLSINSSKCAKRQYGKRLQQLGAY